MNTKSKIIIVKTMALLAFWKFYFWVYFQLHYTIFMICFGSYDRHNIWILIFLDTGCIWNTVCYLKTTEPSKQNANHYNKQGLMESWSLYFLNYFLSYFWTHNTFIMGLHLVLHKKHDCFQSTVLVSWLKFWAYVVKLLDKIIQVY